MKTSRYRRLYASILVISIISLLGFSIAPAGASTTTYSGNGSNRAILERASNATAGSITANNTAIGLGLPGGTWTGYQLDTVFTSIARNADFAPNGVFSGSTSWAFMKTPSYSSSYGGNYIANPPTGTTTGSCYVSLKGNSTVQRPLNNMNFTSSSNWAGSIKGTSGSGTFTSAQNSTTQEWQEKGTYAYSGSSPPYITSATVWCNQSFTYSGSIPPQYASLSYKFYVKNWLNMANGSMTIKLILTNPSSVDNVIFTYYASSTTSKPASPTSIDITSFITATGTYTVKLYAFIFLSVWKSKTSTATVSWDDVGVYTRYGKYAAGSHAEWSETSGFGQYAITNGLLSFKYWTNLTMLAPSADSYISAWVNSTALVQYQYNITAFSSILTGSWQSATLSVPASIFNGSSRLTIKVGLRSGSLLQINSTATNVFYFDNITFFAKYKPTPVSIKLGLYDDWNHQRWNDTETTYGSGAVTITPSSPRSTLWSGSSASFHFVTNATNGKPGYNATTVSYSYTSTMYANRWTWTDSATFLVHDDTRTSWYCNYTTPSSIGGYQNYNVSVYVPTDWIQSGLVSQIKFGGVIVSNYVTVANDSYTSAIKMPAAVFAPNPPRYRLEIWTYSPNYVGPSQTRTLLFTQCNNTNTPGSRNWANATSFISKNITRLACYIRDLNGFVPLNVNLYQAQIRLYNESGNFYLTRVWSVYPFSNGTLYVQLGAWADGNVTWHSGGNAYATYWHFAVNWTNNYEAANGIAGFTTNSTLSRMVPTTLTSPSQPYTATYQDGFTLTALYTNARNGTGLQGASVAWRWTDAYTNWSLPMSMSSRGTYTADISGPTAYSHFAPPPSGTWIQIVATLGGYISQNISVRVFVRNIATAGSASTFIVPYPTYAWNSTILVSFSYTDLDHTQGITNANLYINNTLPNHTIGSSGIGWFFNDLGSGNYQIVFSANATRTGLSTWCFTATANKSHYQPYSVFLNYFNIRDRLTTHTEPYLSVTTPWGDNVSFLITYRDADSSGNLPILGATATCNWANGYTVTSPFGNGTYRFSLNTIGLSNGTYSFSFSFNKSHWTSITAISAQVVVRNIHTNISTPTSQINVYWGDNATEVLIYRDIDHNQNISTASWNEVGVYDAQTGMNYTGSLIYNIYLDSVHDSWILTIKGSLPVGNYTLWVYAYVSTGNGYYESQLFHPVLNIKPIAASLTQRSGVLIVVWTDTGKIVISYNDTVHGGVPIEDAGVSVLIDPYVTTSWYENGTGVYTVFFNTTNEIPRTWGYTIQVFKTHYSSVTMSGNLQINAISTDITVPSTISIPYGSPLAFTIYFEDLNHTQGIFSNPSVFSVSALCNWTQGGVFYTFDYRNGSYLFNLDSTINGGGLFELQVNAYAPPYYKPASRTTTIIIRDVNTSLAPHSAPAAAPWGDNITLSLDYYINATTRWVTGATITTNWTLPYSYFLTATGQWQLELNTTGLAEGIYPVRIDALRQYYQNQTISMNLTIRSIHVEMRLTRLPDKVVQGNIANISVQLWDLDHLQGVTGASLTINGINSSLCKIREVGGGYYEVDVDTATLSPPMTLSFAINATKTHYMLPLGPGQASFEIISPGFSTLAVILMSGGSGGAVILLAIGFVMYRRARRPYVIKKIEQSLKLISKGSQAEPVEGLRSRTDTPLALLTPDLESLGVKLKKEEPKSKEKKQEKSQRKKLDKKDVKEQEKSKDATNGAKPEEGNKETKKNEGGQ